MNSVTYGIGQWDAEQWGNHRAIVEVACCDQGENTGVRVTLPWRRCDKGAAEKGVFVRAQSDGSEITPVYVQKITSEEALVAFTPQAGEGIYEIYYLRYEGTTRAPYPQITYRSHPPVEDEASYQVLRDTFQTLPFATLLRFEAIDELHSFYPMEVCATRDETARIGERYSSHHFLLFPEDRLNPIRMRHALPLRWIERGAFTPLHQPAHCHEYVAFQVGVYAHRQALNALSYRAVVRSDLEGDDIAAEQITCFNLEGTDWNGTPLAKRIDVPVGAVQPLWFGVDLPEGCRPGEYRIELTLTDEGGNAERVEVVVAVDERVCEQRGDDIPELHSRLRWLNSNLGRKEELIAPYTPVRLSDSDTPRYEILGRAVSVGEQGIPCQIESFFTPEVTSIGTEAFPILMEPMRLAITDHAGEQPVFGDRLARLNEDGWGEIRTSAEGDGYTVTVTATVEPDGCMEYDVVVHACEHVSLAQCALEIPLRREVARYMLGLGHMGGELPMSFSWKWDVAAKNQDALWVGCERAGLQLSLHDENYRRPLNTNFYRVQPLRSPRSWDNEGRGGITLRHTKDAALVRAYSGEHTLEEGEKLHFSFRLLVTPFRPLNTDAQWSTRFYHEYGKPEEIKKDGATVVNIHHAKPVNPYINYPFLRPKELGEYVETMHAHDMKLRLYYTVRELTNHACELFAIRSLGDEIFAGGPGGGHSWLQEHFHDNYIAAWHVFAYQCVAIATTGQSRLHNYYVEGLRYLTQTARIDGIYIDDLAFDRTTMKRVRRVLDANREGALIDLHSANQYNEKDGYANSMNLYMEHLPYLDRVWFGEYFDYARGPAYWMTEVAGIPFGTMGEMLQDGGHMWRGMLYGMTSRYPHGENADPRSLWRVWA